MFDDLERMRKKERIIKNFFVKFFKDFFLRKFVEQNN
jgi:hypothetical protein